MGIVIYGASCKACGRTAPIEKVNFEKGDCRCNRCISEGRQYKFWTPGVATFVITTILLVLYVIFK